MSKRTWKKCNVPAFVTAIVVTYWTLTITSLGGHHFLPARGNALADAGALLRLPGVPLWSWLPDIVVALALGGMTLWALYVAALNDPGSIPKEFYESKLGDGTIVSAGTASAAAYPTPSEAGSPDVTCVNAAMANPSRILPTYTPSSRRDPLYCEWCQRRRPPRTHHCRRCQQCVVRYDHHCDWIDNCVGQANHKCFLLFIFYILSCILHYYCMVGRYVGLGMGHAMHHGFRSGGPIVTAPAPTVGGVFEVICICMYTLIVFPCSLFAAIFLISSVWNMLRNETSFDTVTVRTAGRPQFHRSLLQNVKEVLGPDPKLWLVPSLVAVPTHVHDAATVAGSVV